MSSQEAPSRIRFATRFLGTESVKAIGKQESEPYGR